MDKDLKYKPYDDRYRFFDPIQFLNGKRSYGHRGKFKYHRPIRNDWSDVYITFGSIESFDDLKNGKDELILVDCFQLDEFNHFIKYREFWWEQQKKRHTENHQDKRVYGLWNSEWSNRVYPKKGVDHNHDTSYTDKFHNSNQMKIVRYKNENIELKEVRGKNYSRINL